MDWFSQLKNAKKSCLIDGNLKKIHYLLPDNREMVEEYNLDTLVLTKRIWKNKKSLKGENCSWDVEVGDPEPNFDENLMLKESSNQPFVSRRLTKNYLEWRVRNLPYPLSTYSVAVENNQIVIRTNNKKYFKKLNVPDLDRLNVKLDQKNIDFSHKFNTLIVTYRKPSELLEFEKKLWEEELSKLQPEERPNCTPS